MEKININNETQMQILSIGIEAISFDSAGRPIAGKRIISLNSTDLQNANYNLLDCLRNLYAKKVEANE